MKFTIGNKIFTALGLLFAVFLIFGILMFFEAGAIQKHADERSNIKEAEYIANHLSMHIFESLNHVSESIRLKKPLTVITDPMECEIGSMIDKNRKKIYRYEEFLNEFEKQHNRLHRYYEKMDPLLKKNEYKEAQKIVWEAKEVVIPDLLSMLERFEDRAQLAYKELGAEKKEVDDIITTLIVGLFIIVFLMLFFYLFFKKSLVDPISGIAAIAKKISKGDVDQTISHTSNDELGELSGSFRDMIGYIKESVQIAHAIGEGNLDVEIKKRSEKDVLAKALENMTANLKKIMFELTESTAVLNSAAGEILATTSQVASSAAQTSSAVTQTTSSVEEIKQTARLTSEKAIHTAQSTKKAAAISEEGSRALDKNMEGLAQIKEKMDSIAANIIRLSEQSQTIGNIVATVEDIASQSNLLAVNASIEAVKAGEQGKGFSVVAQELKNLADQSKQGTAQVQKILSDIQQATNTLVMVAEQGGKAVDAGMVQAKSAKESMQSLKQSVAEAAQAGTLIASSSEQEMAGMDQIADAMMSVQEATTQNVESIRQVEESAKNLNDLSMKLKSLMDQYSFGKTGR